MKRRQLLLIVVTRPRSESDTLIEPRKIKRPWSTCIFDMPLSEMPIHVLARNSQLAGCYVCVTIGRSPARRSGYTQSNMSMLRML